MYIFSKIFKTKHLCKEIYVTRVIIYFQTRIWGRNRGTYVVLNSHVSTYTSPRPPPSPPPHTHPQTPSNSICDWLYTLTQAEGMRLMARWARHWPSACWCWPRHFAPGPAVVGEVLGVQQVSVPRSPLRTPPWHSPAHETPPSASSRVVNRAYVVQQRHLQYRSSYLSLWGCCIFTLHVGVREEHP